MLDGRNAASRLETDTPQLMLEESTHIPVDFAAPSRVVSEVV